MAKKQRRAQKIEITKNNYQSGIYSANRPMEPRSNIKITDADRIDIYEDKVIVHHTITSPQGNIEFNEAFQVTIKYKDLPESWQQIIDYMFNNAQTIFINNYPWLEKLEGSSNISSSMEDPAPLSMQSKKIINFDTYTNNKSTNSEPMRPPLPETFIQWLLKRWKQNVIALVMILLALLCLLIIDSAVKWLGFGFFVMITVFNFIGEYNSYKKRKQ